MRQVLHVKSGNSHGQGPAGTGPDLAVYPAAAQLRRTCPGARRECFGMMAGRLIIHQPWGRGRHPEMTRRHTLLAE